MVLILLIHNNYSSALLSYSSLLRFKDGYFYLHVLSNLIFSTFFALLVFIIVLLLQMRNLNLREVKFLTWGHMAIKWLSRDENPS